MAGPEFEELKGHVLVMHKILYSTRSGGVCWHDKHFDILQQMDFKSLKADPDIWMKLSRDGTHYACKILKYFVIPFKTQTQTYE